MIHDVGTRQLMDLAELLAVSVRTRYPGAVRPAPKRLQAWAKEIGKIGLPPEEIAATIQWLFSPANEGEFCFVVQSGSALREKYGRITAKMEKPEHGKDQQRVGKIEAAARNVAAKIGMDDLDARIPGPFGRRRAARDRAQLMALRPRLRHHRPAKEPRRAGDGDHSAHGIGSIGAQRVVISRAAPSWIASVTSVRCSAMALVNRQGRTANADKPP